MKKTLLALLLMSLAALCGCNEAKSALVGLSDFAGTAASAA